MTVNMRIIVLLLTVFLGSTAHAQKNDDANEINAKSADTKIMTLESTIKGNQEQPQVLTIVPWQPPTKKVGVETALHQRIVRQLAPIEPEELKRQADFHKTNTNKDIEKK